jgi:hypothetical protein
VFDAEATKRIGVKNLEAMRRGLAGYASGGLVAPAMSSLAPSMPSPNVNVQSGDVGVKLVVVRDEAEALQEALNTPKGERVLIQHFRDRPSAYNQALGRRR